MKSKRKKTEHAQHTHRSSSERPVGYFTEAYIKIDRIAFEEAMGQRLQPEFRAEIERRIKEIDSGTAKSVDAFGALKKM